MRQPLLIKFGCGMVGDSRRDPKVTADTKQRLNLGQRSGRWIKQLYPDEALSPCQAVKNEFYQFLVSPIDGRTLPWPDEGIRLMPPETYLEITDKERECRGKWETAVEGFFAKWNEWVDWARREHNGSFDQSNYNQWKARRSFYWSVEFRPVPDSSQYTDEWRNLLGVNAAGIDATVKDAVSAATTDLWARLAKPLQHVVQFLSEVEGKDRTRFCESLVTNIRDIASLVPRLNLSQDANLAAFAAQADALAQTISLDGLKESKSVRRETSDKVAAILKQMDGYFPKA